MASQETTGVKSRFDMVDLSRVILAFMVVCIHVGLCTQYLIPYLRLSVPLFFMISAFFFFRKTASMQEPSEKTAYLKKFVIRNLKLYLFYFILLLPVTLMKRQWFSEGIVKGIGLFFKSLLFGSTFVASWFIMASVIGVALIFLLSQKLNNIVLLMISGVFYLEACMASNYYGIFHSIPGIKQVMDGLEIVFGATFNNFLVALLWIVLGKMFAEQKIKPGQVASWIILCVSLVLLTIEHHVLLWYQIPDNNDCYIMLVPACICIFSLLINAKNVQISHTAELRKISVMVYATHGTVIVVLRGLLERFGLPKHSIILLALTLLLCGLYCVLILKLEKYPKLKWLKYAY